LKINQISFHSNAAQQLLESFDFEFANLAFVLDQVSTSVRNEYFNTLF